MCTSSVSHFERVQGQRRQHLLVGHRVLGLCSGARVDAEEVEGRLVLFRLQGGPPRGAPPPRDRPEPRVGVPGRRGGGGRGRLLVRHAGRRDRVRARRRRDSEELRRRRVQYACMENGFRFLVNPCMLYTFVSGARRQAMRSMSPTPCRRHDGHGCSRSGHLQLVGRGHVRSSPACTGSLSYGGGIETPPTFELLAARLDGDKVPRIKLGVHPACERNAQQR